MQQPLAQYANNLYYDSVLHDEAAFRYLIDYDALLLGREMGYTGVALKAADGVAADERTGCGGEPELLKRDFFASLCAAYTLAEVRSQLAAADLAHFALEATSDRHWITWGALP